jgi:hypothetical protein
MRQLANLSEIGYYASLVFSFPFFLFSTYAPSDYLALNDKQKTIIHSVNKNLQHAIVCLFKKNIKIV